VPLWIAPDWWWAASAIMLLASILLVGSFVRNPAFPASGRGEAGGAPATGVFAITRHPMNWSFILWALVHISVWGPAQPDRRGGILVLAGAGSIGQDRKKRSRDRKRWQELGGAHLLRAVRRAAQRPGKWRARGPGWIALGGGFALWLLVTWPPRAERLAARLAAWIRAALAVRSVEVSIASSTASGATLRFSSSTSSPASWRTPRCSADRVHHRHQLGHLMLGQQADLEVEVGALVGQRGHPVLADQDEGRQEDRLDRRDHRQHDEALVPGGTPGTQPRLATIQKPKSARCR
jgi:protein-S-isoprenylcysteine O-methyltransferase Ste14